MALGTSFTSRADIAFEARSEELAGLAWAALKQGNSVETKTVSAKSDFARLPKLHFRDIPIPLFTVLAAAIASKRVQRLELISGESWYHAWGRRLFRRVGTRPSLTAAWTGGEDGSVRLTLGKGQVYL